MLLRNEVISLGPDEDTPAARRAAHSRRLVNGSRGVVVGFRRKTPADEPAWKRNQHNDGGRHDGGRRDGGHGNSGNDGGGGGGSSGDAAGGDGLPAGWATAKDAQSGREYFYRVEDPSVVSWERPTDGDTEDATEYPEVRFTNGRTKLIMPEDFSQSFFRRGTLNRSQVPPPNAAVSPCIPRLTNAARRLRARSVAHRCRLRSRGRSRSTRARDSR